jgi:2-polyprenyl-3-methyl-5-hydroxy-6-metoxy-1,4-benzoquinol methylase
MYSNKIIEQSLQVDANSHYKFSSYVTIARWNSYWHQIKEVTAFNPKNILIIGAGDDIVGKILAMQEGIDVYTFDFDEALQPDFIGNITEIDTVLQGKHFDIILCCQVLEHLPYEKFEDILQKIKRVATIVIISLPYSPIYFMINIKMSYIGTKAITINIHRFYKNIKWNGEHYWEIGRKGYTKRRIKKSIRKFFHIEKCFIATYNHYHIFFVLK